MERFERRRIALHDVELMAIGLRFGEYPLHHLVGGRTPHAHLHAVARLERAIDRGHVLDGERSVESEAALLARSGRQSFRAVGAAVQSELGDRVSRRRARHKREAKEQPPHRPYSSRL